ncbi:glycosyltransferase family 2 protein [Planctomycetota bacterium]
MRKVNVKPLVSVIVPTYNRANIVCSAIESILAQTYQPLEIIVVDDGSTDETESVLRQYNKAITYVKKNNGGVSSARNRGVAQAKGEIICFLDSDDLWLPEKTEIQVDLMMRAGQHVPCCVCDTIFEQGDKKDSFFEHNKLSASVYEGLWVNALEVNASRFSFLVQSAAIRRHVFSEGLAFNENLWVLEDLELAFQLARIGPWAYTQKKMAIWKGGSDHSLCVEAEDQPMRFYQCLFDIYNRMLVHYDSTNPRIKRQIKHQLRNNIMRIRATECMDCKKETLGRLIFLLVRLADALWRRFPGNFPVMEVQDVL